MAKGKDYNKHDNSFRLVDRLQAPLLFGFHVLRFCKCMRRSLLCRIVCDAVN